MEGFVFGKVGIRVSMVVLWYGIWRWDRGNGSR